MKVRFSELSIFSCFAQGRSVRKKVEDEKALTVSKKGKVSTRKVNGDPEVEPRPCPLNMLGVGQRRHPETLVQIGDGNLLKKKP